MAYKLLLAKTALKDLASLPKEIAKHIDGQILALADEPCPHNSRKLKGHYSFYRLRVGPYRILYIIDEKERTITIVRAGNRKDVYRGL